jgi:hypothetical protein
VQSAVGTVLVDQALGAVAALSASAVAAGARGGALQSWSARDPGSGLRRHLACRVLLI